MRSEICAALRPAGAYLVCLAVARQAIHPRQAGLFGQLAGYQVGLIVAALADASQLVEERWQTQQRDASG